MDIRGLLPKAVWGVFLGAMMVIGTGCSYLQKQGFETASTEPMNYKEENGKIDLDSICAEQADNEKAYRRCSREADVWLEQQCNSYRGLFQSSDMGTAERYRREYHKFCDAAAAWEAPEPK